MTQNASVSISPISRPITSRRPVSCTEYATTSAFGYTWPRSRTLTTFASSHRYGCAPSSGLSQNAWT